MFSAFYGLAPINNKILQERVKLKFMPPLTQSELEVLKEAEDIMFKYVDYGINTVFDKAFCQLHIALKRYKELEKEE